MSDLKAIDELKARLKKSSQSHDELLSVLEDYRGILKDFPLSSTEYRTLIQVRKEELPDLERIAGKKHDPILKGRLIDALNTLGLAISHSDNTSTQDQDDVQDDHAIKRVRNIPNLGMS